jgi:putative toxin-antitoxin system antitoxin component (TIGR02293 family)
MTHPIARIAPAMWERAVRVFGQREKAARWMETSLGQLGELTPAQILTEDPTSEAVEAIIGRIEGGVFG